VCIIASEKKGKTKERKGRGSDNGLRRPK